ncbi:MAG: amidohydrolase family protein [Candidatus Aminicenantes bacterium]|jgi:predicted TIM-barrel fold metal-dependent hydrolase
MIQFLKKILSKKHKPEVDPGTGPGTDLDFKIIDAHVHIPSDRYLPGSFTSPIIDNMYSAVSKYAPTVKRETIADTYKKNLSDHECDELIKEMNQSGVEQTILLLPDFTYQLKDTPHNIDEMIENHVRVLEKYPDRFYLFVGIDPRWGEKGQGIFKKYLEERKIHGLKVYPPCGYFPTDEGLTPYYQLCTEHRLPVIFHTGPTSPVFKSKYSEIRYIDEVAHQYPEVNFILAHGGVMNVDEAVLLCAFRPNVYLDISGFLASLAASGPMDALRSLFKRKINHKIIFGTDWPILGFKNTYANIVRKFKHPQKGAINMLTNLEKRMILRDNILYLLNHG